MSHPLRFSRSSDEGAAHSLTEKRENGKYVLLILISARSINAQILSEVHLAGRYHLAPTTRKQVFSVKNGEAVRFVVNLMLLQLCYACKEMYADMSHIQHSSIIRGIGWGV
jgi:hypothetical protein